MRAKAVLLVFFAVCGFVSASLLPAQGGISRPATLEKIDRILRGTKAPRLSAGVAIGLAGEKVPFYVHEADLPLIPASNQKVVTTGSALLLLGLDHEIKTDVVAHGDVKGGVLTGNLRVRGEGDPTYGAQDHGETLAKLEFFAERLLAQGIRRITGDLLVDDSAFDQEFTGPEWPTSDPRSTPYLAQVAALSLDDGCVRILVTPGAVGKAAGLSVVPDLGYVTLKNSLVTVDAAKSPAFRFDRDENSNVITAVGTVRRGASTGSHYVTVHDPALHFGFGFKHALEHLGIVVDGKVRRATAAERTGGAILIRYGTPLSRVFPYMLKESQNHRAEMVFKHLGFATSGAGTFASGGAAVGKAMDAIPAARDGLVVADGSGLSRRNRVTARTMWSILSAVARHPSGEQYRECLAEPGEAGTLEKRLPSLQGRLFAKTGTLNGVSTLSGYVLANNGRWIAFSMLMNGTEARAGMKKIQDDVVEALAGMNADG